MSVISFSTCAILWQFARCVTATASKVYVTATPVQEIDEQPSLRYSTWARTTPNHTIGRLFQYFFEICPEYLSSQLCIISRENSKSHVAVDVIVTCSNSWTCYWMSGHMPLLGWVKMTTICVARKSLKTRSTRIVEYNMQMIVRPVFQILAKLFYAVTSSLWTRPYNQHESRRLICGIGKHECFLRSTVTSLCYESHAQHAYALIFNWVEVCPMKHTW